MKGEMCRSDPLVLPLPRHDTALSKRKVIKRDTHGSTLRCCGRRSARAIAVGVSWSLYAEDAALVGGAIRKDVLMAPPRPAAQVTIDQH